MSKKVRNRPVLIIISVLVVLVLSGTVAYGDSDNNSINDIEKLSGQAIVASNDSVNSSLKDLSLEEALQIALENNYDLQKAAFDKKKAFVESEQANDIAHDLGDDGVNNLAQAQVKYVSEKQKAEAKKVAARNYEVAVENVKLAVQNAYYSVLLAHDVVSVNEAALERAQKQLETAEASYNVGTVAKVDVLAAQVGVSNAKAQLIVARNNSEIAEINLKRIIGLDLNYKLKLTSKIEYTPFAGEDLASSIKSAYETRLDVLAAMANIEVAKESYRIAEAYTASNTYASRMAKVEMDKADLALEDTKKQVVSDLIQAYLNILAAQEVINSYKAAVDQSGEQMRLVNLRYQVGMATSNEVLDASVKLADIQGKNAQAIYSFAIAKLNYEAAKKAPLASSPGN